MKTLTLRYAMSCLTASLLIVHIEGSFFYGIDMNKKKCPKCGEVKNVSGFNKNRTSKDGLGGWCRMCLHEYNKEHSEEIKEKSKRYYKDNIEKCKEHRKKYYSENSEVAKERSIRYYQDNKEEVLEKNKEYRKKNVEKLKERSKKYREDHKEKLKIKRKQRYKEHSDEAKAYSKEYNKTHSELIKKYKEEHAEEIRIRWKNYYKSPAGKAVVHRKDRRRRALLNNCEHRDYSEWEKELYSKKTFKCYWCKKIKPIEELHIDHVIAISRHGDDTPENTVASCKGCNLRKSARLPSEFVVNGQPSLNI